LNVILNSIATFVYICVLSCNNISVNNSVSLIRYI
jgi:hypothetical protein